MSKYIYIYVYLDTHDIHDTHEMFKTSSELVPENNYQNNPIDFHPKPGGIFVWNSWVKIKSPKNSWVLGRFRAPYV